MRWNPSVAATRAARLKKRVSSIFQRERLSHRLILNRSSFAVFTLIRFLYTRPVRIHVTCSWRSAEAAKSFEKWTRESSKCSTRLPFASSSAVCRPFQTVSLSSSSSYGQSTYIRSRLFVHCVFFEKKLFENFRNTKKPERYVRIVKSSRRKFELPMCVEIQLVKTRLPASSIQKTPRGTVFKHVFIPFWKKKTVCSRSKISAPGSSSRTFTRITYERTNNRVKRWNRNFPQTVVS